MSQLDYADLSVTRKLVKVVVVRRKNISKRIKCKDRRSTDQRAESLSSFQKSLRHSLCHHRAAYTFGIIFHYWIFNKARGQTGINLF